MFTEPLSMATQVAAGITLLALLWLAARAFKRNIAWGLGVLLLSPIGATVFGLWFWERERAPFLAFIGALAVTLGMLTALFSAWGGWELVDANRSTRNALENGTLTRGDVEAFRKASLSFTEKSGIYYEDARLLTRIKREFDRQVESDRIDARIRASREDDEAEEEVYSLEDLYYRDSPGEKERYRLVYRQVRIADAHKYVGSTVKVTRRNVPEKEYRLVGATRSSLKFTQKNRNGSFSFAFRKGDIEKIRVLFKEPS